MSSRVIRMDCSRESLDRRISRAAVTTARVEKNMKVPAGVPFSPKAALRRSLVALPRPVKAILRLALILPVRSYIRFAPWIHGKLSLYNAVADHLWWLEGTVSAPTTFGATLRVNASDIVGKHLYYFGVWEPTITKWIAERLKPGDCFVDVGANLGYYTLLASKIVGQSGEAWSPLKRFRKYFGRSNTTSRQTTR